MKTTCRIAIVALLLVSLSPLGIAQMGIRGPDWSGIWNPVIGAGGSYETHTADGRTTHPMDMFIAGKESVNGKDAYWIEMAMEGGPRGTILIKVLTAVDGSNYQSTRKIIQFGGQPPMEMTGDMMSGTMAKQGAKMGDIRSGGQNLGSDTVTVPAGTFACDHWRSSEGGDVWISPKAPPFGLIKTANKDGSTFILVKLLTDEKDRIVGTPVPFDPMRMMQQGRPPQQ
jgi:hypothetical protein